MAPAAGGAGSCRRLAALALLAAAVPAAAGPPFITDDPMPTDLHHWEIYGYGTGTGLPGGIDATAGLDINYGGLPGVQLTATLPVEAGRPLRYGVTELAVKYRFLYSEAQGVALAVFPRVFLPTDGRPGGRVQLLLPAWGQKDWGPWSLFGGGGYMINPGSGNRNYWQQGLVVTRRCGDALTIGVEIAHRGTDAVGGRPYTAAQIGVIAHVAGPLSFLVAAGPGLENRDAGGRYNFYTSLLLNL